MRIDEGPEAVTGWLFPASLATHVVLVAARRNDPHHAAFADAVVDVVGVRTEADLARRRRERLATLPSLRRMGQ